MADYNGYTIKRTHAQAPFTSVHEAVAADGRPGRFALKVFHPPPSTDVRRVYAIEGWLLAAERQQKSAKKDGTVLEVLTFGRCEEGAFTVLPWQENLLEPRIKTLHPKGDTLRALAECLFGSLEKWEAQTGGPHGSLKAPNIFFTRKGSVAGMTAQFSDPAHLPGVSVEARRQADFAAIGTMLAQIVRRRPPGAWPIEDAPEWKALGHPGKGWLAFCNYLLNPSPKEGELTIAEARKHLRRIPRDANPVKTAALTLAAIVALSMVGVVAFARFGDPIYMPDQLKRLAQTLGNTRFKPDVPIAWVNLCKAWDTWLIDLQSNGPRLLRTEALWEKDDPLRKVLADFVATSNEMLPSRLVPESASEKRLGVLADSPPQAVLNELQLQDVIDRIDAAGKKYTQLSGSLLNWPRWNQLRELQRRMEEREFPRIASTLETRLPPRRGSVGYKFDMALTLKFFNDLSLDSNGALLVSSRWSEITGLRTAMEQSGDRIQQAMPRIILGRLTDSSSLSNFADSLGSPLDEMRQRRNKFLDPQVVRELFLKESPLQAETPAEVTAEDFPRWEEQINLFTLVTREEDPRLAPEIDASGTRLTQSSVDLEQDAPAPEPGGLPTFSQPDFQREFAALTASLKSLRERPIVRRDLPAIGEETTQMAAAFRLMEERMTVTLSLLKPEIWLGKVAEAYGKFNETKQRWAAWQATIASVTADMLRGDKPRFRTLRAQERQVKEWIDGVEGPNGFGALAVPELKAASADTAAELVRLEGVLRERSVAAVAAATEWRNALPTPWAAASAAMKAPLEAHREWLARMPDFATDLDQLSERLLAGFGWTEGVDEIANRLAQFAGVNDLTSRPAEWYAEAKQLEPLVGNSDRGVLTAAVQGGRLAQKLMAWRGLGTLADWPAGAADFDLDTGTVKVLREFIGRDVKDETRRGSLSDELLRETRRRFNHAAWTAARAEEQLTAMYQRMDPAGITEADLEERVAYNLALWRLKREDWNETNLGRLRDRRDRFVASVRPILPGLPDQSGVKGLLDEISGIELVDDPNRAQTPTPAMKGWQEEPSNEGLTLTATWRKGSKVVQIEYHVIQPEGLPPFYLAARPVAVGEFVDLINARTKEAEDVYNALPQWVRTTSMNRPWNKPLAWRPRSSGWGLELNPSWILLPDSQVQSLLSDADQQGRSPVLAQAVSEKPTPRTPLQQIPPKAAKLFAEQVLGARLPKTEEWRAVAKQPNARQAGGFFRGPRFRELWSYLQNYNEGGQVMRWRPNEGIFLPAAQATGGVLSKFVDDGAVATEQAGGRLWFAPVDEGPETDRFVNLFGNVWIYLCDAAASPADPFFYVAGGSALSPPSVDIVEPQKVEPANLIGATQVTEGYTDVGIRPAFEAPPGFKERYKLFMLVRNQSYLTM